MFGPFQYNQWHQCEVYADGVRFRLGDAILVEVLGGMDSFRREHRDANIELCEALAVSAGKPKGRLR